MGTFSKQTLADMGVPLSQGQGIQKLLAPGIAAKGGSSWWDKKHEVLCIERSDGVVMPITKDLLLDACDNDTIYTMIRDFLNGEINASPYQTDPSAWFVVVESAAPVLSLVDVGEGMLVPSEFVNDFFPEAKPKPKPKAYGIPFDAQYQWLLDAEADQIKPLPSLIGKKVDKVILDDIYPGKVFFAAEPTYTSEQLAAIYDNIVAAMPSEEPPKIIVPKKGEFLDMLAKYKLSHLD